MTGVPDVMVAENRTALVPLLRSPPFPTAAASISRPRSGTPSYYDADTVDRLFAAIRKEKVGGDFWHPPAATTGSVIVRARSAAELAPLLAKPSFSPRDATLWLLPADAKDHKAAVSLVRPGHILFGEIDPWSLLRADARLYAHGDDEWVALAHIAGAPVNILSNGRFGFVDDDAMQLRHRTIDVLQNTTYLDPFTKQEASIESVIAQLGAWRRTFEANQAIVAACGIAWWKRHEIARFLWTPRHGLRFFRSERRAIAHAAKHSGAVAIWPSRVSPEMAEAARTRGVSLVRVEDGFVRSIGLGANLVPPSSIVVDRLGIHYDPGQPSDLEAILSATSFPPRLLERAQRLHQTILDARISKYGGDDDHIFPARAAGRRLVLVTGQVEDDMSVKLGGGGLCSNLEVLRRARIIEPDAEIWFRPHPDVDAGHRRGIVRDGDALAYADRIVRGGSMGRLLDLVDSVHVLTSLTGFEALLRGRKVTCHGTPFYAGWGLTHDLASMPNRRGRSLTIEQLLAAVLILYPRYLDPVTGLPCPAEILINRVAVGAARNRLRWVTHIREW